LTVALQYLPVDSSAEVKTITCEELEIIVWGEGSNDEKICAMRENTIVESENVKISPVSKGNNNISVLSFYGNKNIFFLPESPSDTFRNLRTYEAFDCLIKKISYDNFRKLRKLKKLYLNGNHIETIGSDTFVDLENLEELHLSKKVL
jgi:Leucine-rich repeat (LRR) protein